MHAGEWSAYVKSALYYFDFQFNLIMNRLKHGKSKLHLENWLNKVIRYLINTKDGGLIVLYCIVGLFFPGGLWAR